MSETIWLGSGKEFQGKFGPVLKIYLFKDDIEKINSNLNSEGGIILEVNAKKPPLKGKSTHSIKVDFWKPEAKPQTPKDVAKDFGADEAPF
jgi:hypothetical protein